MTVDKNWETLIEKKVVAIESPISDSFAESIKMIFDSFTKSQISNKSFAQEFDQIYASWASDESNRKKFGGYYTPYFRNSIPRDGFDDKIVWQFHKSFLKTLTDSKILSSKHSSQLNHLINIGIKHIEPFAKKIAKADPDLLPRLLPKDSELPVVVRLMKYVQKESLSTNPHVDKTAISNIIWTDDPLDSQCLIFDISGSADIEGFIQPNFSEIDIKPSYVFFGAAISNLKSDTEFKESTHAVMPFFDRDERYSIAIFWVLSDHSMKDFSTKVEVKDKHGIMRKYER